MFEELIGEFSDDGGLCENGLYWFFNGFHARQGKFDSSSDESGYDSFAGYLPDYCAQSLVQYYDLRASTENMETILDGLREGRGAELSFDNYAWWERTSGHSVTLWGMVYRTGADLSEKESWQALVISDSDNDKEGYGSPADNRRTAPNTLNLYRLAPVCFAGYDSWCFAGEQKHWDNGTMVDKILSGATLLLPYSDSLEKDGGTRNAATCPDLTVNSIETLVIAQNEVNYTAYFAADHEIGLDISYGNHSKTFCPEGANVHVLVTKRGGGTVYESEEAIPIGFDPGGSLSKGAFSIGEAGELEPGVYDVTATISAEEEEAYLSNNSMTTTFYISTRSRTDDDLAFGLTAVYDRSMPFESDYGARGRGHVELTYSGELGYDVARYEVIADYYDSEINVVDSQTIYVGKERPDVLYGLEPIGSYVQLYVYAVPEDPTVGYERFLPATWRRYDTLSYIYVKTEAEEQTFSPISETDTRFADGESLQVSFQKYVSNTVDSEFRFNVEAKNQGDVWRIYSRWFDLAEFGEGDELDCSVADFDSDPYPDQQQPLSLPAGTYDLWAYTLYSVESGGYQYQDYRHIGTLTVLPGTPELTDVFAEPLGATETEVACTVSAPLHSAFTIVVHYGTAEDALDNEAFANCEDFDVEENTFTVSLPTLPETTYYYQVELCGERSGVDSFTAPSDEEPPKPEPPACELLLPDADAREMRFGEEAFYETFLPAADGTWRVTLAGPDGVAYVWDEDAGWGEPVYFTLGGRTIDVPARKDAPIRLRVYAYVAGGYQVTYEPDAPAYREDGGETSLLVSVGADETCLVAAYASDGRLLSVADAGGAGLRVVPVADGSAARARVFHVDRSGFAPRADSFEYTLGG